MKLYTTPRAPNPVRVTMFMAEKGITDIPVEVVNLMEGQHRQPEYRAKSPLSQVPALEIDDGRVLTESRAICTWLEGAYPEPNLMGVDHHERAFIEMWDRRMELSVFMTLVGWIRNSHPALAALEPVQFPDYGANAAGKAEKIAKWVDKQLEGRAFLAGDRFTIADITGYCAFEFGRMMKFKPWETLPNLGRWHASVAARPSAKAVA